MNQSALKIITMMIIAFMVMVFITNKAFSQLNATTPEKSDATTISKNLENVLFEKMPGKERINLVVSSQPGVKAEGQTNGSLLIKLEDTSASTNLLRSLGEGQLNNILRVIPSERVIEGKKWVYLTIDIRDLVPYSIKQEGKNIFVDFNITGLPERKQPAAMATAPQVKSGKILPTETSKPAAAPEEIQVRLTEVPKYTERKISIDFQDADIKSVLRLMAEYGNVSIVSGDDVKGNVTLSMKNVPWEQALDTIMDVHSLAKRQENNVFIVTTIARSKKDATEREQQKVLTQKLLAEKGLLKQILIEAKIVEASESFVRTLGVSWGFTGAQSIGTYGSRISGGTNTGAAPATNAQRYSYPPEITMTDTSGNPLYMAAVNMAAGLLGVPTLGVVFGKGSSFLEAQLAALEANTTGKILSSPKVVTMDDVKAVIKQGTEVPYVTPASGNEPATVSFKDALLKLEVKPRITAEGKISMEIKASNDRPDWSRQVQGNPPIAKNEVESTVVIDDGDTVVIGGVTRESDEKVDRGLPWLLRIPILGYLFKQEELTKDKRQLLIFVTPKILKNDSFAESSGKIIN